MIEFARKKVSSIYGKYGWIFYEKSTSDLTHPFEIAVNAEGLVVMGESPVFRNEEELNLLAKAIGEAWGEFRKLSPKENDEECH